MFLNDSQGRSLCQFRCSLVTPETSKRAARRRGYHPRVENLGY
ncbi:MAG: hypothetical protein ACTSW3_08015 [Promethearchaeota archaeon]